MYIFTNDDLNSSRNMGRNLEKEEIQYVLDGNRDYVHENLQRISKTISGRYLHHLHPSIERLISNG